MNDQREDHRSIRRVKELEDALAREITDRQRAEARLRLQCRIADSVGVVSEPDAALNGILDALAEIDGIDCGGVHTRDRAEGGLRLRVHRGLPPAFVDAAAYYPPGSPAVRLAASGSPAYGRPSELLRSATTAAEPLRALAVIPVVRDGEVYALLHLGSRTADEIPAAARGLIEAVRDRIADVVALVDATIDLRAHEQNVDALFNSIEDLLFILDASGRILRVNRAVQRRLGFAEEELIGRPALVVYPADRREEAARLVGEMLAGAIQSSRVPLQAKSGELVQVETRAMPGMWGAAPALFGVSRDVTQREVAALELRTERDFARLVMETMAQGLTVTDESGGFVYVNPAYARTLGYSADALLGRSPLEFTAPEARVALAQARTERQRGEVTTYESRLVRPDGQLVPVAITGAPWWRGDRVAGAIAVITDLTMQKRSEETRLQLERQVLQAQKRSGLGTMAAGIAHHFNNLLTVILGNLDLACTDPAVPADTGAMLRDAARAAQRASRISDMLLTYVGRPVGREQRVPLSRSLDRVLSLLRPGLPANIHLETDLPANGPTAIIEPDDLEQVVVNLVMNAAEAIGPRAGRISVRLGVVARPGRREDATPATDAPDETLACLEVSDTGHGMSHDTQARMFDPFFTTRMTGRGLGLAVTLGIVQARNGSISVESAPEHGTTVRVLLPAAAGAPPAA